MGYSWWVCCTLSCKTAHIWSKHLPTTTLLLVNSLTHVGNFHQHAEYDICARVFYRLNRHVCWCNAYKGVFIETAICCIFLINNNNNTSACCMRMYESCRSSCRNHQPCRTKKIWRPCYITGKLNPSIKQMFTHCFKLIMNDRLLTLQKYDDSSCLLLCNVL